MASANTLRKEKITTAEKAWNLEIHDKKNRQISNDLKKKINVYTASLIIYTKSTYLGLVKLSGSSQAVSTIIFNTKTYFPNRVRQKQRYVFNYP